MLRDGMRYLFAETGVYYADNKVLLEEALSSLARPDALVLYDINEQQKEARIPYIGRALIATSPRLDCYKEFQKQLSGENETYYMKTWSWEEIYLAR